MTKAPGGTWTATITPKRAGSAGTLGLTVKARDEAGGQERQHAAARAPVGIRAPRGACIALPAGG